ncbi:MAG: S41 family peptidase [Candidatus Edwardsbacteria bacterium]
MNQSNQKGGILMFTKRRFIIIIASVVVLSLAVGGLLGRGVFAIRDNIYENLRSFSQVLTLIQEHYVTEVQPKKLIFAAIKGMISSLDPYSQFLEPQDMRDLRVSTQGRFGGLGIQIGIRDNVLTVISPMFGTPAYKAGIQAGDRIVKIEGKSTKGITTDEAVKKLRGEPGTQVTITIQREGVSELMDYTITRAIIQIDCIPYYGLLNNRIGYIELVNFSEKAGPDIAQAIDELEKEKIQSLILDLRYNSGGLLNEAVEVASNFIDQDSVIVSTKGREPQQNRVFRSLKSPLYGKYPLIVLVNEGSASASEIVAGAIQDWDRGLVLGQRTFGKGSVQSVIPLPDSLGLKLTVAKYYTPSNRCIHRDVPEEDTTALEDTTKSKEIFYTVGKFHRNVYGGGGIAPDIVLESPQMGKLAQDLVRKGLFFKFAVKYTVTHKPAQDFEVNAEMLEEFKRLLSEEKVSYELPEFKESETDIKTQIKREILAKLYGEKAMLRFFIDNDPWVKKAIELLKVNKTAEALLKAGMAEAK